MPLMQQAGEAMAKVLPLAHRGLEQRFLNVAWHIAPNGHRRLAQQQGKVCCSVMSLLPDFYV